MEIYYGMLHKFAKIANDSKGKKIYIKKRLSSCYLFSSLNHCLVTREIFLQLRENSLFEKATNCYADISDSLLVLSLYF